MARAVQAILEDVLSGTALPREDAYLLSDLSRRDMDALCFTASMLRDQNKGRRITFSPKVFIPLTKLCRDFCGYCTFRKSPDQDPALYMTPEEVLEVARAGQRLGCAEALFTLGERPEQRYLEARHWLAQRGYKTTLQYLRDMCALILEETALLPHANPGTMSEAEMASLKEVNASLGLMLENLSLNLFAPGAAHEHAPSKHPSLRLRTLELAGQQHIPFTTGLLIGIGENLKDRIDTLFAIRELNNSYGHIQEVIIQNFRAKPATPMSDHANPTVDDVLQTAALARLILGGQANIQVPPNLTTDDYPVYLRAGINDWGGISPLTIDFVNPEAPWPQLSELGQRTARHGFELRPRLALYPEFITEKTGFVPASLRAHIYARADEEGLLRGGMTYYDTVA